MTERSMSTDELWALWANDTSRSTLARGEQIERDFYYLKSLEFGPRATAEEIKGAVVNALAALASKSNSVLGEERG